MNIRQKLFWYLHARNNKLCYIFSGNPHFSPKWIKFLAKIFSDR